MAQETTPQYDAIGERYNRVKEMPATFIEQSNFRVAVAPYIQGARVLDLACGTGYYSRLILEWGASQVVGVDLSSKMVAVAEKMSAAVPSKDKLRFLVGDANGLGVADGGEFDLVTGVWLLPYAADKEGLAGMLETAVSNLREGGVFVGITTVGVKREDMEEHKLRNDRFRERKIKSWGMEVTYTEKTKDGGYGTWLSTRPRHGDQAVEFLGYHLPCEAYEAAAREAGFKGKLEWKEVKFLDEIREEAVAVAGEEFFRELFEDFGVHFGVIVIDKSA